LVLLAAEGDERFDGWVRFLEREGLQVLTVAPEPQAVRAALRQWTPQVALLDLSRIPGSLGQWRPMLPALQAEARVPLIGVISRRSMPDLGAVPLDDVLDEGAPPEEVLCRVRRALPHHPAIVVDGLLIDAAEPQILVEGRPIAMPERERSLLRFLASRPDRVFRREDVLQAVWGAKYRGSARTVDTCVRRLRARLGDYGRRRIQTVRGVGYRLTSTVALVRVPAQPLNQNPGAGP
jgi:DNA-binding response OmpR family regulator